MFSMFIESFGKYSIIHSAMMNIPIALVHHTKSINSIKLAI